MSRTERFRYRFRRPFQNGVRSYSDREGVRLILRHEGRLFAGEAAPLPGHSAETVGDAETALRSAVPELERLAGAGVPQIQLETGKLLAGSPSARFAAETALLGCRAAFEKTAVARLLSPSPAGSLYVNAVVTAGPGDTMKREVDRAVLDGIRCLKIKLGPDLESNRRKVAYVRGLLPPGTALRGDANGGWSREIALRQLEMLAPFGFEYVEQPLPVGSAPEAFAWLRKLSPVLIAADESASSLGSIGDLITAQAVDVIVLKPSLLGGMADTIGAVKRISSSGLGWVVTHALDGAASRRMLFELARALPVTAACHGISRGSPFIDEKEPDGLEIASGMLRLQGESRGTVQNTAL